MQKGSEGDKSKMKYAVHVMYKPSILDPQGEAVKKSVHNMGYAAIEDVRLGKYFELTIADDAKNADEQVAEICDKLLANTVMETFRFERIEEER